MAKSLRCVGFDPPLHEPVSIRRPNRVLPFRMELFDEDDLFVTDFDVASAPVVQVTFLGPNPTSDEVPDVLDSAGKGDDGNQFTFDGSKWGFNLRTKDFSAQGTYEITAVSGNPAEYVIDPTCTAIFVIE